MNAINAIFKSKHKSEIDEIIRNIKISSYNLNSFFSLTTKSEADHLINICNFIDVNPKEMEISLIKGCIFDIINKYFDIDNEDNYEVLENDYNGKLYCYSPSLKIIIIEEPYSHYMYLVFPKRQFNNILYLIFKENENKRRTRKA
jgi:hypothetical protein